MKQLVFLVVIVFLVCSSIAQYFGPIPNRPYHGHHHHHHHHGPPPPGFGGGYRPGFGHRPHRPILGPNYGPDAEYYPGAGGNYISGPSGEQGVPPPPPPPPASPAAVPPAAPAVAPAPVTAPLAPGSANAGGAGNGAVNNGQATGTGTGIANVGPDGFGIGLGIGLAVATPLGNIAIGQGNSAAVGK